MRKKDIVKKNFHRVVEIDDYNKKIIHYDCADIFDDYTLKVNNICNNNFIEIKCHFIDYDIEDNVINRKIKITKKAAFHIILDLLKYIFTNKL